MLTANLFVTTVIKMTNCLNSADVEAVYVVIMSLFNGVMSHLSPFKPAIDKVYLCWYNFVSQNMVWEPLIWETEFIYTVATYAYLSYMFEHFMYCEIIYDYNAKITNDSNHYNSLNQRGNSFILSRTTTKKKSPDFMYSKWPHFF